MPGSANYGKAETVEWLLTNKPGAVRFLDIGCGYGTYHDLLKPLYPDSKWLGVEVWSEYIHRFNLFSKYTVINMDARGIDYESLGEIDVAIAGDVLEHMTKQEAIDLVDKLMSVAEVLVISVPIVHYPQDEQEGNPYEVHVKDDWSHEEVMDTWGPLVEHYHLDNILGVYFLRSRLL